MTDEETRAFNAQDSESANTSASAATQPEKKSTAKDVALKGAFVAGGFAAGMGTGVGISAHAEEPTPTPEPKPTPEPEPTPTPDPEESIVATDEGVRVAQVNDDASFSEAFADARAQVGPGGVFEWHGKVYGTYYKTEWDAMSPAERSAWQKSVDYSDVLSDSHSTAHTGDTAHTAVHGNADTDHTEVNVSGDTVDVNMQEGPTDNPGVDEPEVRILGVEVVEGPDGSDMIVGGMAVDGQEILLVDIDADGTFDVVAADFNRNGVLDDDEYANVEELFGGKVTVQEMQEAMEQQNALDDAMAHLDETPDYMSNANVDDFLV